MFAYQPYIYIAIRRYITLDYYHGLVFKGIVNAKSLTKPDLEGLCCTYVYMQSGIYSQIDKNQGIGQLQQTLTMCCALKYQIFSLDKVLFMFKINMCH